ncbi:MAG: UDP-3-O-acyl-N-acetylglucosamine deacetylase [Burkholderiaceae bacterium]
MRQRTIKSPVRAEGVGLHSGQRVQMTLRPAPVDSGIVFTRSDLNPSVSIKAGATAVNETAMASTLTADGPGGIVRVQTVEHLMSALAGLGVDNVFVDVTASEIPILDGSAASFVYLIQSAGFVEQSAFKRFIEVRKTVRVGSDRSWAQIEPHFGFKLSFSINFAHPAINSTKQEVLVDFEEQTYVRDVANARTFGFMQDVEMLRDMGLARGGSFGNAIVMDEHKVLNDDGLRSGDEFAKHKILDAIGDLYIIGAPLLGAYTGFRAGHALNNELIRALVADDTAWRWASFRARRSAPNIFENDWAFA